jgi:hypothetical protein
MSDLISHTRDDLNLLPCDCELPSDGLTPTQPGAVRVRTEAPAVANVGHPCSYYLRLPCRTLAQAVRDVSRVRDLDDWVWELLYARPSNVISMAEARRRRR